MKPVKWGRLLTAMVTPFDSQLEVDYAAARRLAETLVSSGTDAIVVGGTTGEAPSLSHEEKIKLWESVVEAVGDRVPVIAGTGTNSTRDSIELSREAEKIGVHGIMLVTPYYNKPPQTGLVEHFMRVAGAVQVPVLLYNVPGRTGVNMLPATVETLAAVPNIVAVKEAAGSTDQFTEIVRRVPADFLVYSGDDSMTLPAMSVGAYGVVSVVSHVVGPLLKRMIDLCVHGDVEGAARIHRDLFPLFKAAFVTTNPIPIKTALKLVGINVGTVRPPLSPPTASEEQVLKEALVGLGLLR